MAKYITSTDQNVALNNTIPFNIVSIPCNKGCVVPITTGVLTLKGSTSNRFARYEVDLQANIAGVAIPDSVAIVTPAAVEDVWHIHTSATITVPCGCCVSVSAAYVDATEDDATVTPTPSIFVRRNASLTVDRIA